MPRASTIKVPLTMGSSSKGSKDNIAIKSILSNLNLFNLSEELNEFFLVLGLGLFSFLFLVCRNFIL